MIDFWVFFITNHCGPVHDLRDDFLGDHVEEVDDVGLERRTTEERVETLGKEGRSRRGRGMSLGFA